MDYEEQVIQALNEVFKPQTVKAELMVRAVAKAIEPIVTDARVKERRSLIDDIRASMVMYGHSADCASDGDRSCDCWVKALGEILGAQ